MFIRYWILLVVVGLVSCWLLAGVLGGVLLAGFLAVWPCSLAAIFGITMSESASNKAPEIILSELAEQVRPKA